MTAITTLTLNPALDVSTSTPEIRPADKLRCAPERRDPGGGGINLARVIRRLGGDATAVYPAGGSTGAMLTALLKDEGLPGVCVPIRGDTRESFTVSETATGREFRFVLPGPAVPPAALKACLDAVLAPRTPWLAASGGLPPGAPQDIYARLARRTRRSGQRLAVDCAGPALRAALVSGGIDVLIHLAALPSGTTEAEPAMAKAVNLDAAVALFAEAAAARPGLRVVHASSIAALGPPQGPLVTDDTPLRPTLTYGALKVMLETWLSDMSRRGDVRASRSGFPAWSPGPWCGPARPRPSSATSSATCTRARPSPCRCRRRGPAG